MTQKIEYIEYQRDQAKKELEDCERKLGMVTVQLRKTSDKTSDDQEQRRQQNEKKYLHQIEVLKETHKSKCDNLEEANKKLREEARFSR